MIIEIKEKLLTIGIVKENEYLDKYCNLILENVETKYQVHKTQSHHIIPKYYCRENCPSLIKDKTNKVNLLYKDHILAHYYLALCSTNKTLAAKNVSALFKMTNSPQTEFNGSPIEFIETLDKYQELYEIFSTHQGDHLRGKKQSPEHIAQRVHKNTGQNLGKAVAKHNRPAGICNSPACRFGNKEKDECNSGKLFKNLGRGCRGSLFAGNEISLKAGRNPHKGQGNYQDLKAFSGAHIPDYPFGYKICPQKYGGRGRQGNKKGCGNTPL